MSLGNRLQELRKKAGLSQEDLAQKLDVTRQTISKWELDQSSPDLVYLVSMSDIYDVTTDYLIKGVCQEKSRCETTQIALKDNKRFILGLFICTMCALVILIFLALSIIYPWGTLTSFGYFEGLMGFLLGTKTIWIFIVIVIVLIGGIVLTVKEVYF